MTNMKCALKKKIHALDFAVLELGLYLDTHPWDKRALHKRHHLLAERKAAVAAYEEKFGPLLPANGGKSGVWAWGKEPWPWEGGN